MSDKSCPRCGRRVAFSEYLRTTSLRFACRRCGAGLGVDLRRAFLAPLVSAVLLGFAGSQALAEPVWWFGVAAALGLSVLVHYGLLRVDLYDRGEAARPQA